MTHKERFETAWSFKEPDRVPIEARIIRMAEQDPRAQRLMQLIAEHADNVYGASAYNRVDSVCTLQSCSYSYSYSKNGETADYEYPPFGRSTSTIFPHRQSSMR